MRKIFFIILALGFFACGSEKERVVFQGDLKEFVVDSLVVFKDSVTSRLKFQKIINFNKGRFFVSKDHEGYDLFDILTGKKEFSFRFPKEGPMALKGHPIAVQVFNGNEMVVISSQGQARKYLNGQVEEEVELAWTEFENLMLLQMQDEQDNFIKVEEDRYLITTNPFDYFAEEEFVDMNYGRWFMEFDFRNGWVCNSNFKSPLSEEFSKSSSAAIITSVYNGDDETYFSMFTASDSIYQIKNCKVEKSFELESLTSFTFLPGIFIENGRNRSWRSNPDSDSNISLVYDPANRLYIRTVLVDVVESNPEISDIRLRHGLNKTTFLLLVYNLDWQLIAELETVYEVGETFGKMIAAKEGLFINKPEQVSEDEYEFYKIDLSRFVD